MRTLIEVTGGLPLEIRELEVSRERKGVLKGKSEIFIKTLSYLLYAIQPPTGNDDMEYIAFLLSGGSAHIYFRRKPERNAFPKNEITAEDLSFLGEFIRSFNAQFIIKRGLNRKKEMSKWIERTIKQGCMEKMQMFIKQLSIRI